jgi:hypothetical protein
MARIAGECARLVILACAGQRKSAWAIELITPAREIADDQAALHEPITAP